MRAMVTGGTRGIGSAISHELASKGYDLLLVARNSASLERQAIDIQHQYGVNVALLAIDLSDTFGLLERLRAGLNSAGIKELDALVLNAGTFSEDRLQDISYDTYMKEMALNLHCHLFVVQSTLDLLRRGHTPRIVIIGSTAAYETYPDAPSYGIAKWGLRGMALNLRHELRPDRIGVTFIAPGGTLTDMWAGEDVPGGRLLDAADVAKLVAASLTLSSQAVVEELIVRPIEGDMHE